MTSFAPIVEVLFDGTNWTDITRYVRTEDRISIGNRGRTDDQSQIQPATMSLTLNNDGRFTPTLASGAYYPYIKKGKRIRLRVIYWATNLITNSSFEAGTTGWSAAGTVVPTLAQSNTHVQSGSQALRITWGTGGTGPAAQITLYGLDIGSTYTASAYVYVPSGGSPAVRLGVSGISTGTASAVTNAFTRITYTFTATNTTHVLQVTPSSSPTSGQQVWVDAVQVEAGSSATTYSSTDATISSRYDGYVNEWPTSWEGGQALTLTQITCTDLLKRLGGLAAMRSLLEEEMLYLAPDAYYTLGEESGATSAGDTSGAGQSSMTVYQVAGSGGSVDFGAAEGPGPDGLGAVGFVPASATDGKGLRANLDAASPTGWIIACFMNTTTAGRDFLQICNRFSGAGGAAVVCNVDSADGSLKVTVFSGEDTSAGDFGPYIAANLGDGETHLVAVLIDGSGNVYVTIDSVDASSGLAYGSIVLTGSYDRIVAGGFKDPTGGSANLYNGSMSHVWAKRGNSMPSWANVWSAGNGSSETTTARFMRLCRLLGVTGSTLGGSGGNMDPQAAGGKAPIQALRDVAAVEAGLVYASRSTAEVVLECRNYRYNKASSITLDDADVLGDITWSDDDQPIVNDVTNQRLDGADQRVTDTDSIDAYGVYSGGDTQPWETDYDALANAQWIVNNHADPDPRITQVSVTVNSLASYATLLGLDISDVITLSGLPATSPRPSVDLHLEGYSEVIEPGLHAITFNTSPAAASQVWQLGTSGHSELGTTTRLAL